MTLLVLCDRRYVISWLLHHFILFMFKLFLIVRLQTFLECAVCYTYISFDMYSRSNELLKVLVFYDVAQSACVINVRGSEKAETLD